MLQAACVPVEETEKALKAWGKLSKSKWLTRRQGTNPSELIKVWLIMYMRFTEQLMM